LEELELRKTMKATEGPARPAVSPPKMVLAPTLTWEELTEMAPKLPLVTLGDTEPGLRLAILTALEALKPEKWGDDVAYNLTTELAKKALGVNIKAILLKPRKD
jgi:hypothetical protein